MVEIWAKSKEITLRCHTKDLLNELKEFREKISNNKKINEKEKLFKSLELLKYAIFFHDLGKVSPKFQKRIGNTNYPDLIEDFPDIRHNILSLFFINKKKVREILREICDDNDESLYSILISSVAFHHWTKHEKEYLLHLNNDLIKACEILLKKDENWKKLEEILKENFKCFKINGKEAEDLISFDKPLAEHIKAEGNLMSVGVIPPYTLTFLPERLRAESEQKIDSNLWIFLSGFLMRLDHFVSFWECEDPNFKGKVEKEIPKTDLKTKLKEKFGENFWQKEFLNLNLNLKDKNIILIAPTGIGKTEFAFLWAEGEKFFYTLPSRVATNQIFDRACLYFNSDGKRDEDKKSDDDPFVNGNVGLLHSDADLFIIDKWETSKDTSWDGEIPKIIEISRHLSLPVIISTGDQIFPSALKYPGYERIYATLGYSKLIIDEVQAYDPRACAIIVKMIEDIVSLGGKFLLMTATLPGFIKEKLKSKKIEYVKIDLYEGKIKNGEEERDTIIKIKDIARHKIELKEKDIEDDVDEIIKKANIGKRILVVLNTVEKAESIYEKIKDSGKFKGFLELLHSRFTLNERKKKEKKLEEEFKNPKPENENSPKILVATQVVEASLDIDADYLFTEIAPIDSLIQRMGRVMRRVDSLSGKIKNSGKEFKYEDEEFYPSGGANIIVYFKHKEGEKEYLESGKGHVYKKDILVLTLEKLCDLDGKETDNKTKTKKKKDEKEEYKDKEKYKKKLEEILNRSKEKVRRESNGIIELNESKKNRYVEEVYGSLNEKFSSYLQNFYETLKALDSGYVSENKEEAHNIFREIYTVQIIDKAKIDKAKVEDDVGDKIVKIVNKISDKINKANNITWLWFKKEIIAEYVINENMWRYKEYELNSLWDEIKDKIKWDEIKDKIKDDDIKKKDNIKKKLKNYCSGIYVVKSGVSMKSSIIE